MLNITHGKGFQMTFANGWTASVQFGYGNYCERRNNEFADFGAHKSKDAECWAMDANGKGDGQPQGWLSADEVLKFLNDTASRLSGSSSEDVAD